MNIGKEIKNRRLSLNMTMDYVANKAGITRATLSSIENGSLNCSVNTLSSVLKVLDMSLEIKSKSNNISNRSRATRTNTLLIRKINEFIIMCVEEYANYVNQSSDVVYKELSDKQIIKELEDDYEDLHGMSKEFLNDYISALL